MTEPNLTAEGRTTLLKLLRDTIDGDRFPLSPRIRTYRTIVAKLDPAAARSGIERLPPPKAWVNSSIGQRKRRR